MYSVFRDLAIIILSAKFFGLVARKCRAPQVVGEIIPFAEVTQDCALAEGDGTLAQWREVHRKAFETACAEIGTTFDESMKCVCEYFEVVYQAQW